MSTMTPARYRVMDRFAETADTVTLALEPVDRPLPVFRPGQFAMLYAFGVGEVPISVSGRYGPAGLLHTVRAVGATSAALHALQPGRMLGVRGPYGQGWPLPARVGADLVVVAGGLGLAPLRPLIRYAAADRARYRRVAVLIGARTPDGLLYPDEYDTWRAADIDVLATVDRAAADWTGRVGVVTALYDGLRTDPARTAGYLCGPEVMMRFAARDLLRRGVAPDRVWLSLERNMHCGTGHCGHCQLGPLLLCRDGPVARCDRALPLLAIREL
ncbi:FAD/NAD(P)-binding protein [Dactylosporangium vinaceum]|uniref:FAD/NAD(P)-binding protein n=1 Tax=Dactylosporangium vinaceum TaxID=53362 RepID=A0ABV5MKV9_9ACTN|nr:FAD/NAD(P)-binding protein [Dactylosporangium vinaceum]UAB93923.1 FAD/NAD(P)-binding protein [Dactylosporangium vinaceum]